MTQGPRIRPHCLVALALVASLSVACGGGTGAATTTPTPGNPPVIATFRATPAAITAGQSTSLSWSVTGATTLSVSPGPGAVSGASATVSPATTTTYTLTATNASGTATASTTVTVTPTATVPGAPSNLIALAGIRSALVAWSEPSVDGGSPVTGYAVQIVPAAPSASVTVSGTSASISGLANGTIYAFTVAATNAVGTGTASAPSNAITTPDVPGAPTGVVAVAGNASATLSWSAPASTGGMPITGYTVVPSPAAPAAVVTISGTGASITGLTNGAFYAFQVYATNAVGPGPSSAASNTVRPLAPTPPPTIESFTASPTSITEGGSSTLGWSVTGATSLSLDPGIGTVTGSSRQVSPTTTTTYTLTATGTGGTASATATVTVTHPTGVLAVACSGARCGATSPTQYAGSGVGIWKYRNGGATSATVDLSITGVAAGNKVTLVFSNGGNSSLSSLPSAGALGLPPLDEAPFAMPAWDVDPRDAARDAFHAALLEENRTLGLEVRSARGGAGPRFTPVVPAAPSPVAVGDTRQWRELVTQPVATYDTVARAVCDLPGGRKAVIWVDAAATTSGHVTADDVDYFRTTFCGPAATPANGGHARVTSLLGDVWGDPALYGLAGILIGDSPLQDVNVVFLSANSSTWAGYFWGLNNFLRSYSPSYSQSNEALAFFIDATQVHFSGTSRSYLGSALLHELTHMANFFQRDVVRDVSNDTWLEETTATMTDDMISPAATPDAYHIIPSQRVRPYLSSGGAISLLAWRYPTENSYSLAGTFAAHVDRRYGTAILAGTVGCTTGDVACMDGLIRAQGGTSFADDFARAGATAWSLLTPTAAPDGYGYPQKTWGSYTLPAVDPSAYASYRLATAKALPGSFPAGSHTYQLDTVGAGRTSWVRTGVVVPAGTEVMVVVQ